MNSRTIVGCLLMTVAFGMIVAVIARSSRHSAERRLDEEAVARMDDEGASNNPVPAIP
jgi:hypothetical protein